MSYQFFSKLVEAVNIGSDRPLRKAEAGRWIKKYSDDDLYLMVRADVIEACSVTRHIRASLLRYDEEIFLCISGLEVDEVLPVGYVAVELTPSLFMLAVENLNLVPNASALDIFDVIDSSFYGEDSYDGHDLEDVVSLFPDVTILQLDKNLASSGSIWRSLGVLLSVYYGQGPIELSEAALDALRNLYEAGSDHVPFRTIVQGHLSMSWGGLFLELYRAIEQLYSVPKLVKLTDHWASSKPFYEVAELLENQLGWRPKEEDSLRELIESCDVALLDVLASEFCPDAQNKSKGTARAIYSQRNALVHFRPAMTDSNLSTEKWNDTICCMIELVADLYGNHGESFMLPRT